MATSNDPPEETPIVDALKATVGGSSFEYGGRTRFEDVMEASHRDDFDLSYLH